MDTLAKILNLLQTRNIEQQEFAKAIGVRKQAISEWKKGTTKSYMKYIDKIAEFFDVSVDYLLDVSPTQEQTDEFSTLIQDCSPEEKEQVKQYIEFIKSQRNK